MKRVYVASPLSSPTAAGRRANVERAWALCAAAAKAGAAPLAVHGLYPLFLDDQQMNERRIATDAGLAWLLAADELWVFTKAGISKGMAAEIRVFGARLDPEIVYDPACWEGIE